jgi:1,4-alpha-glucan branching enzyme
MLKYASQAEGFAGIVENLGSHVTKIGGVSGTRFAVWAPNASRVSVVGDFNNWDGRINVMRLHPSNGIWEIFVPAASVGAIWRSGIQASTCISSLWSVFWAIAEMA